MSSDNILELGDEEPSWHVLRGNDRSGPYRSVDLIAEVSTGAIKSHDFIWRPGWSDWREFGAFARSSPSLADMCMCEEFAQSAPASPPSVLAHRLELRLRPSGRPQSWFGQLNRHHIDIVCNVVVGAFLFGILAALSTLIFDNIREGIVCTIIEFAISFLLALRLIDRSTALRLSSFRWAAPLATAGALLLVAHANVLPDAFDTWHGRQLAKHLHTSTQVEQVAQEHPGNKFLALLKASFGARQRSVAAAQQLIDEFQLQDITLDAVLKAATLDQLSKQAQILRIAAARATLVWSDYLKIQETERIAVEQAGRDIYGSDPLHLLPKFIKDHAGKQELVRAHMDKSFAAIAAVHSAKANVADFMASHLELSHRSSGAITSVADQEANLQLRKLVAGARAAEKRTTGLDQGIIKIEENNNRMMFASSW
jgi:hypothetical protein